MTGLLVEINECLRDSPKFRQVLHENEKNVESLESRLERAVKHCATMVDQGRQFAASQNQLLVSLWEVAEHFSGQPTVAVGFNGLLHSLAEFNKYQAHVVDQASRTITKNFTSILKKDIRELKESRQCFERISGELDTALSRYAVASKSRPLELEETANLVRATRTCFRHTALDYLRTLSLMQARKEHEVLDTVRSYMQSQVTYFHQGNDICNDLEPQLKAISTQVAALRAQTAVLEQRLETRHSAVTHEDALASQHQPAAAAADAGIFMEGYLFKRTTNAFKTWNRRWFTLENHQLKYRRRTGEDLTMMEEDLRLCTVKPSPDLDRRHCFEVVSPQKSHVMQADSEPSYRLWVEALQAGIGAAFDRPSADSPPQPGGGGGQQPAAPAAVTPRRSNVRDQVRCIPGNEMCCDCGRPDPTWASINLGITLCIECSGIHRSLGVHVSKIRSLTLDAFEPEIIKVLAELGNTVVNGIYEACVDPAYQRPVADTERSAREAWIRAKYAEARFVRRLPGCSAPHVARRWSVRRLRRRPRSVERRPRSSHHKAARTSAAPATAAAGDAPPASFSAVIIDGAADAADTAAAVGERLLVFGEQLAGDPPPPPPAPGGAALDDSGESTGGEDGSPLDPEGISSLHPDSLLYKAAEAHNLPVMCSALALRADPNWHNTDRNNCTPLHAAVTSGSVMACQHLLLNGSKADLLNSAGQTPLHLAVTNENMGQICVLLKHKANQWIRDGEGHDPLEIAMNKANADIVTVLRVGRWNEHGDDDTFNQVVRDFSRMASDAPDRLSRRYVAEPPQPSPPQPSPPQPSPTQTSPPQPSPPQPSPPQPSPSQTSPPSPPPPLPQTSPPMDPPPQPSPSQPSPPQPSSPQLPPPPPTQPPPLD